MAEKISGLSVTAFGFDHQRAGGLSHEIQARAHHLRLAAQRVGVLHALAGAMRFADLAAGEQLAIGRGDPRLSVVAAKVVDARIEGDIAALQRIEREGAAHHRGPEQRLELEQRRERQRRGDLRAVQQRQALLRAQLDRRDARLRQSTPPPAGSHRRASGWCPARAWAAKGGPAAPGRRRLPPSPAPGRRGTDSRLMSLLRKRASGSLTPENPRLGWRASAPEPAARRSPRAAVRPPCCGKE